MFLPETSHETVSVRAPVLKRRCDEVGHEPEGDRVSWSQRVPVLQEVYETRTPLDIFTPRGRLGSSWQSNSGRFIVVETDVEKEDPKERIS